MALAGEVFCISGSLSVSKKEMTDMLKAAGATVASSLTAKVTYVLSTAGDVAKKTSKTVAAQKRGIPVVAESFVHAVAAAGKLVAVKPHLLSGGKPAAAASPKPQKSIAKAKGKKATAAKGSPAAKSAAAAVKATLAAAASAATAPEPIDTNGAVPAPTVGTDSDSGEYLEVQMSQLDLAKNVDKFYKVQVLQAGSGAFFCAQHWGRTGAKGQVNVDGPFPSKEFAVAAFEAKFAEKAGAPYAERLAYKPKKGKYRYKAVNYARVETGVVMWQYWVGDGVDGKPDGWYDYFQEASAGVDAVYVEWQANPWLDVRCIQSGHWSYKIDFDDGSQTNIATNKTRKIRRTVGGVPSS